MLNRYDAVLAALHAGVVIHGPDSAILEANDRARNLLGLQDLEGRLANDPEWAFLEADRSPMTLERFPVVQVITTRQPLRDMIGILRPPSGVDVWLEINALPVIDDSGQLDQVIVTFIDITDRVAAEQNLLHLATHDDLTGLPNRAALLTEIGRRMDESGQPARVAFVDLDRFRVINESLGHRGGDDLLVQVASRLTERLGSGEMLGRLGGDEFVVVLGDESPDTCVERLLSAFDEPFQVGDAVTAFSASIGVAHAAADAGLAEAEDLLDRADTAMFAAKHDAAARWRSFDSALRDQAVRHVAVAEELRVALAEGQIRPDFQPVYALADGALIGVEALARWHRSDGSVWLPGLFLDVCAGSGQMVELGRQILDEACRQVAAWDIHPRPWLAVNIAAQQLVSHDFPVQVTAVLAQRGLDPQSLHLELIEAYVLDDELAPAVLERLHTLGVGLTIDDFGTGWSSLARLASMPVSALKVDRQFVATVDTDSTSRAIVASVAALAQGLGMTLVAEGVETIAQLDIVRSLGIDAIQGYSSGRPGALADIRPFAPEVLDRSQ